MFPYLYGLDRRCPIPTSTLVAQTERLIMTNAQLELSLGSVRVAQLARASRPPSTLSSRWWFRRMRQIVDRALDWQPAPPARPEQIWLPGTHRRVNLSS